MFYINLFGLVTTRQRSFILLFSFFLVLLIFIFCFTFIYFLLFFFTFSSLKRSHLIFFVWAVHASVSCQLASFPTLVFPPLIHLYILLSFILIFHYFYCRHIYTLYIYLSCYSVGTRWHFFPSPYCRHILFYHSLFSHQVYNFLYIILFFVSIISASCPAVWEPADEG